MNSGGIRGLGYVSGSAYSHPVVDRNMIFERTKVNQNIHMHIYIYIQYFRMVEHHGVQSWVSL